MEWASFICETGPFHFGLVNSSVRRDTCGSTARCTIQLQNVINEEGKKRPRKVTISKTYKEREPCQMGRKTHKLSTGTRCTTIFKSLNKREPCLEGQRDPQFEHRNKVNYNI
uniref:Uncharacterized protein n=1 Tax=Timema genevievae TaxID=629358 RepID=A0A7R9K4T7_TIMGE|nr:unnamed protein product [Timema genevievae]